MSVIKAKKKKKQKRLTGFANWLFSLLYNSFIYFSFFNGKHPRLSLTESQMITYINEIKIEPRSFTILRHFGK